ncbi:MAG: hypothetical protein JOZ43_01470, partial [Acidobacteriales bacterium]|nr:hypothetical protein [Terriglobales bacterium]
MTIESVPVLETRSSTGFPINTAPDLSAQPAGFLEWYRTLHEQFTPWQQRLLRVRRERLAAAHSGTLPCHHAPSRATESEWKITVPEWCRDQRNQMTGPADDCELVVKMLNSGAPGVMVDLEDSMANAWENTGRGIAHVLSALRGELSYFDRKRNREIAIEPSSTVLIVRARGLH